MHRYSVDVVGLSEELDATEKVGRELGGLAEGKILVWGERVGSYKRKLE